MTKTTIHKKGFKNIPNDWLYLVGYEYDAINKQGEPKVTKGEKIVRKQIDHVDLLLLDAIRGFKERGRSECFKEAQALALDVGLYGQEQRVCDKILQLCGLGFIHAEYKFDDRSMTPKLVLSVDTQLIDEVAEARKDSVLETKRIHSLTAGTLTVSRENNLLKEYLKEYLKESLEELLEETRKKYSEKPIEESIKEHIEESLEDYSEEETDELPF